MRFEYTPAGKKALQKALDEFQSSIEQSVAESKRVIGDDSVEVTASDIETAVNRKRSPGYKRLKTLGQVYMVGGIATALIGWYWESLRFLVIKDPERAMGIGAGVFVSVLGFFATRQAESFAERALKRALLRRENIERSVDDDQPRLY